VNKKTRQALSDTNKNLRTQIEDLESQLHQNTETLIDIIEEVKLRTNLKIDHLLAPYLLKSIYQGSSILGLTFSILDI
jgi:hypothetical protein